MTDQPGGFRGQQRFTDPAAAAPAESAASTPLNGTPRSVGPRHEAAPKHEAARDPDAAPPENPPPYLDLSTGEVFLKTFESASFGAGVPAAEAWADYADLTLVSTVAGETNLTMGSVSAWVRR